MKYAVIIPDGAADVPLASRKGADGRPATPFQLAQTPSLDRLAASGTLGRAATTPPGFSAGSDVCSMSLLGYDPARYHTGRAPLEAAALGLTPAEGEIVYRLNLVTVGESAAELGLMLDHSAGGLPDDEARELLAALEAHWRDVIPDAVAGLSLTPGVSYRNILIDGGGRGAQGLVTIPPHEIPREPWEPALPEGGAAGHLLRRLMLASYEVLAEHEVNRQRRARGERPANMAWIWGQGTAPTMPSFGSRFGLRGAMLSAVDLLRGIASCIGWDRLECPGMTSYHDTDYAAQGRATIEALSRYDLVCCHVESPDEASHQGDGQTKIAAIEAIDAYVVGPIADALRAAGEPWRMLVLPDHYTLVSTRKHDPTPVPFLIAGSQDEATAANTSGTFDESSAARAGLVVDPGHELMDRFIHG